jgi:hypothetical protein
MEKKLTLLELHFDGDVAFSASATNNAPAIGSGSADEDEASDESVDGDAESADTDGESDDGGSRGLVLLGVFVLVVLLAAVARALRGDDADLDELTELDDFADEE